MIGDNISNMDKIISFLNNNSIQKLVITLELILIFSIISLIISVYLLIYTEKLFDNFYHGNTPFTKENTDSIRTIGRIMICSVVASLIFELILTVVMKNAFNVHFTSYNIMRIITVYIAYYIFKYGTKLQAKNTTSIYD